MKYGLESIRHFMKQPALSIGEFLLLMFVIAVFWGGVLAALSVGSDAEAREIRGSHDAGY